MRDAESGFTLIEVLVALVVASLMLAVIFEGSAGAARRLRITQERQRALLYGRYLLLRGTVLDYGAANANGREGALSWTSQEHLLLADPAHLNGLMQVHVVVRDTEGQILFDRSRYRMKALPPR